ncbi:MAG TPA: hypothetical protein VEQ59_10885 [Polyangiaceae bacterium]|nr:hypothetical protein [Polyangiaceae bacterium]
MRLTAPPLLGLLLLANACNGGEGSSEPVATATHALLRVERSARIGVDTPASGLAFAGVVRVPELADPEPLLRLSGKSITLPALGQCLVPGHERDAVPPSDLARAEFLNAGDVSLGTHTAQTLLAPRNFPLDVSGVVYTSRDRASEPLPSGAPYLLKTTGSEQLPPLELRVQAPDELRDLALAGAALEVTASIDAAAPVPVSWRAGDARDTVYIEIAGSEGGTLGVCAFRDSEGQGTLPRGLFGANGAGSLAFHRLREVVADVPALDGAEVRFDFALTADVSFH